MAKPTARRTGLAPSAPYDVVLGEVVHLLEQARGIAARAVNTTITATRWQIGKRIVQAEQAGQARAGYGDELLERLSGDLSRRFGRGFSPTNLRHFRAFYLTYPIQQTPSAESSPPGAMPFVLPWSHYVQLLTLDNAHARQFYETEALRGGWSVRQLTRQIDSPFYERTALSKNKAALLTQHAKAHADPLTPEEEIKDPFVLEFLGLKDEYSESDLEEALIRHLESFLLELGSDFAFIGRQKRLRIGDTWYRIDLIFFHRRLRCLVLIDLKTGAFTHADAGQMRLYCNYAKEHWTSDGENPPVGLILASRADMMVAHYALEGLPNKVIAARYKTTLPDEQVLAREIERTRHLLDTRSASTDKPDKAVKKRRRR